MVAIIRIIVVELISLGTEAEDLYRSSREIKSPLYEQISWIG